MKRKSYFLSLSLAVVLLLSSRAEAKHEVSPATYNALQSVERALKSGDYNRAVGIARRALNAAKGGEERALLLRAQAQAYARQGQNSKAAAALSSALATKALSGGERGQMSRDLGQLYLVAGQYSKAVRLLGPQLTRSNSASSDQYIALADAYIKLEQYNNALPMVRKAIANAKQSHPEWDEMLLTLSFKAQDYGAVAAILQDKVRSEPENKAYWQQLAESYQRSGAANQALAVRELAYRSGLMVSSEEIITLVDQYLQQKQPYPAARLLTREMATGRVETSLASQQKLAEAWTQAHEYQRALAVLALIAEKSDKGELYYRMGEILIEQQAWPKAHEMLLKAMEKGGLNNPGNAQILFGVSCYELHFKEQAEEAFVNAHRDEVVRPTAQQWLDFMRAENEQASLSVSGEIGAQK